MSWLTQASRSPRASSPCCGSYAPWWVTVHPIVWDGPAHLHFVIVPLQHRLNQGVGEAWLARNKPHPERHYMREVGVGWDGRNNPCSSKVIDWCGRIPPSQSHNCSHCFTICCARVVRVRLNRCASLCFRWVLAAQHCHQETENNLIKQVQYLFIIQTGIQRFVSLQFL